jgi:hypothetical protein
MFNFRGKGKKKKNKFLEYILEFLHSNINEKNNN